MASTRLKDQDRLDGDCNFSVYKTRMQSLLDWSEGVRDKCHGRANICATIG